MGPKTTAIWQLGPSDNPLPPALPCEEADGSLRFYLKQYQIHGPIYQLHYPEKSVTVLAGPEANFFMAREGDEVLGHQLFWANFDQAYAKRDLGRVGEEKRRYRAYAGRSYSRGRILERIPYMAEATAEFTQQWQEGQLLDFYPRMQKLVAQQLGHLLTHYEPGEYVEDLITFLRALVLVTITKDQDRAALQDPAYLRARQRSLELGKAIVAAHRQRPLQGREPDVIDDALLVANASGREVSDEHLAYSALGPYLAGLDTVSAATCYTLYLLLKNPLAMQRVVAEVDDVLGQGELSWEKVKTMQTLHGAILETLRFYHPSFGLACQALQPFSFAGYRVESGQEIFLAMTVTHFLDELFPDPLSFDLDRYSDLRNEHRQHGAYVPFGVGDRACLGSGIAEVQLVAILAMLLSHFQFALGDPERAYPPLERDTIWDFREHFKLRILTRRTSSNITRRE